MNKNKSILLNLIFLLLINNLIFCAQINPEKAPDQQIKIKQGISSQITSTLKEQGQATTAQVSEKKEEKELIKEVVTKKEEKKETEIKKPANGKDVKRYELNFENAALRNVLEYMTELFNVTFLPDDAISDEKKAKGVAEVKINFKANKPFSENELWNFLDLILEISNLARIDMPGLPKNFYRITQIATANRSNVPSFIGTPATDLPEFQRIRYLYFVQNRQASQIRDLISKFQSKNAQVEIFQDLNVLIITDSAYNVKTLLKIIEEIDSATLPEMLSVIKLQNADATDVAKLYESLKGKEGVFIPFAEVVKKSRLTEATRVIAEPRTNAVIIFGPKDSVIKLEEFIKKYIDKSIDTQAQKIHVYELNYAPAEQIANILNAATQFGADSSAAQFGGVRGGEKYPSKMFFEPEKQGNRLIIRGEPEDYKLIKKIIAELDQQQPQVAIEVFILTIDFTKTKGLASKIENPTNETLNFQTSTQVPGAFNGIQINTTTGSLVNNLVNLAAGAAQGTTVLSLGKQSVWALLGVLQTVSDAKILSNPFLVATNKYAATVSVGETRRITTDTVIGGADVSASGQNSSDANLSVTITPQINDFGIINLNIDITIDQFDAPLTDVNDPNFSNITSRVVHTNTNVADKEVLAIGGLVKNSYSVTESNVPILSKIPLLGLLFKTKQTVVLKQNLLIFISPRIIRPQKGLVSTYTQNKANLIHGYFDEDDQFTNVRDPIHRWFFQEPNMERRNFVDSFIEPDAKNKVEAELTKIQATKAVPTKTITESRKAIAAAKAKSLKQATEKKEIQEQKTEIKNIEEKKVIKPKNTTKRYSIMDYIKRDNRCGIC